jgi:FkbM family methyltransferase
MIKKKQNIFFTFKYFLKKNYPILVEIKRLIFLFHINFFNKFIVNNKKINFDNIEKNKELLAINNYSEKYIVNSSDKVIGRSLYIDGHYGFDTFLHALKILENKITKRTLIDIGANIGSICIPAIKRKFFENCLAIEPEPYNYNLLSKNIFINDVNDKIEILNIALGQFDDKQLNFELSENNFGDHRIKSDSKEKNFLNEDKRKVITVNTKKLDTIMKRFNPKDTFIWMDTQGYESFILDGGINTLIKKVPMVIEFWPYGLDKFNSYNLLKKNLIKANYKYCYNLDSKYYLKDFTETSLDEIYFYYKSRELDLDFTNLLFFD